MNRDSIENKAIAAMREARKNDSLVPLQRFINKNQGSLTEQVIYKVLHSAWSVGYDLAQEDAQMEANHE